MFDGILHLYRLKTTYFKSFQWCLNIVVDHNPWDKQFAFFPILTVNEPAWLITLCPKWPGISPEKFTYNKKLNLNADHKWMKWLNKLWIQLLAVHCQDMLIAAEYLCNVIRLRIIHSRYILIVNCLMGNFAMSWSWRSNKQCK